MSEEKIIEAFTQLHQRSAARSKTARLRELFDEIEALRSRGFPHSIIVDEMQKNGLKFNVKTFEATFYRIKREREKLPARPAKTLLGATTPDHQSEVEIRKIENPADIRKARKREIDLDDYSNKEGE